MIKNSKRSINFTLYLFEVLASCFVVFIHCKFPGTFGLCVDATARFAVPFFFMISGFFLCCEETEIAEFRKKVRKKLFRTCILLGISFLTFFAIRIIICLKNNNSVLDYLCASFSLKKFLMFLFFNQPFISTHNWFLLSLIICYSFVLIFAKFFIRNNTLIKLAPLLVICIYFFRMLMSIFQPTLFGLNLSNENIYHAWWNSGLVFVSCGILIKKIILKRPFSTRCTLIMFISSLLLMVIEGVLISYYIAPMTYYLFSIAFCFSIFVLSSKWPKIYTFVLFERIGNWTRWVYIFHPAFIIFSGVIIGYITNTENIIEWLLPIITLLLTVLFAVVLQSIIALTKRKNKTEII